ncbi:hypothetical protein OS493_000109 [Desmophyllum pertusum]|uniref:MRN complex-interacting protein N-terminal domain-containing protein n=1 Tax=Desmophyllum pertusum TaxID=174260 RepID=A0A9X0A6M0_9CNID|nr:hypothetical protein OS493_000109 [Desmophyllum pertusum]
MVQEFMILRCFSCTTFQVHQVKKSKKWVCKVCGEKQSVKKVYAQGSGQDCRKHVQKLNMKCGEAQKAKDLASDINDENSKNTNHEVDHTGLTKGDSKWEKFLEVNASDDNGSEDFVGFNVTTERDVFDKASSRGKRKLVWQHGKSSTNHRGKDRKRVQMRTKSMLVICTG